MNVPQTNFNPPFRLRRASHAVITSRDLAKSRSFYAEVVGLLVSDEDRNTLYLRALKSVRTIAWSSSRVMNHRPVVGSACASSKKRNWIERNITSKSSDCLANGSTSPSRGGRYRRSMWSGPPRSRSDHDATAAA